MDNYLHKKFKKQLSYEPRAQTHQQNDKENKNTVVETAQEKNLIIVPNQSTNNQIADLSKSSISSDSGNSKQCISHTVVLQDDSFSPSSNNRELTTPPQDDYEKLQDPSPTPEKNPNGKYVCHYCNLVCSKPSVLQKHIRAHTNERPYPCTSCGFSFKTRSNLYKHCRSRTHANRVMGVKAQESEERIDVTQVQPEEPFEGSSKHKPYKPRFHQVQQFADVSMEDERLTGNDLSHHINEIISKNNSIVNSSDPSLLKRRYSEALSDSANNNDYVQRYQQYSPTYTESKPEEPLNLTNKTRTRCMSEATEPVMQKSLIKELLLKNLYSDMQCVYCKMIFQTVTELELHKLRSCKGKPSEAKYARSSSVNVASILTKNKNAFDSMPQFHNAMFPLNSPGPFLGKTRLVDGDKSKSFSFDPIPVTMASPSETSPSYTFKEEKKTPIKLFGGEVKVQGESKSYRIDNQEDKPPNFDYKLSENHLVKSSLQSGGTVSTNKTSKEEPRVYRDIIRVYENTSVSPNIDMANLTKPHFNFDEPLKLDAPPRRESQEPLSPQRYTNITDFSQNAVKLLTPNLKHPSMHVLPQIDLQKRSVIQKSGAIYNPMNLLVNGKVVRHVPGIPGPVVAEGSMDVMYGSDTPVIVQRVESRSPVVVYKPEPQPVIVSAKVADSPEKKPSEAEPKKFARPNSLALKPTTASLKQHHGLTPTIFNQILISPDTPRVVKKYSQHLFNGNYFSYLGLKSSTKPVYCTLNKTQPFYVPHFKKLSMYSEWRQQDTKVDKLYVSAYDSRQTNQKYSMAGRRVADLIIHSSYKFVVSELPQGRISDEDKTMVAGYDCSDDSPYIRGRGRGKYVCEQCGIRCKKPSMLKKHIRTHSNDRPYTCNHCNFSFKTKGNLTKHMKSKSHTKNYSATSSGPGSSTRFSMSQSSESDTDDSGMDSSDESMTRQQEHEAAYGLLSLSQKTTVSSTEILSPTGNRSPSSIASTSDQITSEEIAQVSKANYAKNKIMDVSYKPNKPVDIDMERAPKEDEQISSYLGKTSATRPLTYPYTSVLEPPEEPCQSPEPKSIKHFNVIQKYAREEEKREVFPSPVPALKVNDVPVQEVNLERKRKLSVIENYKPKLLRNDEVMDLSVAGEKRDDLRTYEIESSSSSDRPQDFDNSAMETLADVATKQVKLDKNTLAKNVASEYLKLATNESPEGGRSNGFIPSKEAISDKLSEGNKSCTICQKSFNKPFQLRLHMNIHYLERPFRCDSCSVSFRTKGHLQKHERSASHYSKLSSSPAQSSSEPRPFKCTDCSIAFRIHGHLAKHLRSKMHIMKLECLAKIPFGLYAELERSNSLLTEINTSDGDQCLESLKTLAKKVFINEPSKLQTVVNEAEAEPDS